MTTQQRMILAVAILASFVAFLDGSVINVALPAISQELGGGLSTQQWVVDAYLISLGALILIAGSLSDLFGRRRILLAGLYGFGLTSLVCAVAPTDFSLIIARALQGAAGALLVPSSLALIISAFSGKAQGKAIGSWTGWTGIAFLIGPFLGGLLVDLVSWRLIFAINLLPVALTIWLTLRTIPRDERQKERVKVDGIGAMLAAIGLGGSVLALIEYPHLGWSHPLIISSAIIGLASLTLFLWHEARTRAPMLPLGLFKVRNFSAGNLSTTAVYAALSIATFLISVFLQQVGGYSALAAGLSLVPVTLIMLLLSGRFGSLTGSMGPRIFMTFGPIISAIGFLTMLMVDSEVSYLALLPGIIIFGVGLTTTVAPLTSAILGSISPAQAGIGSAVNNAVARIAGLIAIALLGVVTGPIVSVEAFERGIVLTSCLLCVGGLIAWFGIRNEETRVTTD